MGVLFAIVVVLAVLFGVLWKREKRSMLNAGVFAMLLAFSYLLLLEIAYRDARETNFYAYMILAVFIGFPMLYLIGSVFLVLNGRKVIRKEGLSLAHLLGPLVGAIPLLIVFAVVALVAVQYLAGENALAIGGALLMLAIGIYGYLLWIAYMTLPYAWFYTIAPKNTDAEFIIVHGSGLINGNVPPLLAGRLDKAIEVYNAGGGKATLIPSGGQGDDEPRAEAVAMTEYLLAKKIPADKIVPEDQSTNTFENLLNSKLIIERRSDNPGRVLFVTSNYHVFRTALIARKVGLKADGIGSPTAGYYLPSAIIREFIAITVMYKWWHLAPIILAAGFWILLVILEVFLT